MVSLRAIRQLSCRKEFPGWIDWNRLSMAEKAQITVLMDGKPLPNVVAFDLDARTAIVMDRATCDLQTISGKVTVQVTGTIHDAVPALTR